MQITNLRIFALAYRTTDAFNVFMVIFPPQLPPKLRGKNPHSLQSTAVEHKILIYVCLFNAYVITVESTE